MTRLPVVSNPTPKVTKAFETTQPASLEEMTTSSLDASCAADAGAADKEAKNRPATKTTNEHLALTTMSLVTTITLTRPPTSP